MANFLNQKEDVVKFEFTKLGRKYLSAGLFAPSFFYFYDDSLIYDSSYGSDKIENQNSIQDRILNDSLMFSCLKLDAENMTNEIANSSLSSDYAPSWSMKVLRGGVEYVQNKSDYYKKSFILDNLNCDISLVDKNIDNIKLENDYILISLEELNIEDDIDNFEIELLYYDKFINGDKNDKETKLFFTQNKNNIIDDYIYDDTELPSGYFNVDVDENYASYYFDILVDDEIDTEYIIYADKRLKETIDGFKNKVRRIRPRDIPLDDDDPYDDDPYDDGGGGGGGEDREEVEYNGSICKLICCP